RLGHGHRRGAQRPGAHLREIPASPRHADRQAARPWPGPGHLPRHRRAPPGSHVGRFDARSGQHVHRSSAAGVGRAGESSVSVADHGLQAEIHSLAAEIVHAYEELHLLYELGEVLTSDLSVSDVTSLIVEKILHALSAGDAELSLASASAPVQVSRAIVGNVDPDHLLKTTLRSAGEIVGTIR